MSFRRRRGTSMAGGATLDLYGTRRLRSVEGSVRCSVSTTARVNKGMGAALPQGLPIHRFVNQLRMNASRHRRFTGPGVPGCAFRARARNVRTR